MLPEGLQPKELTLTIKFHANGTASITSAGFDPPMVMSVCHMTGDNSIVMVVHPQRAPVHMPSSPQQRPS